MLHDLAINMIVGSVMLMLGFFLGWRARDAGERFERWDRRD